jgi:hypothetical protein
MKTTLLVSCLTVVAPLSALAQVHVSVSVPPPPTITFVAPPPMVVVQPGVQVVEDNDDEIFFVDNFYYVRRDGHWFRTRDHKGGWVVVDGPGVPPMLVKSPPGHYRRYKGKKDRRDDDHGHKATSVTVDPPGPGKVKVKVKKGHH